MDERHLIQSVLGGYQDRIEDLRAYAKKFQLFFSPIGLPETGPNVVMVDLTGPGGKGFTRSLDITTDTPTSLADLPAWAAGQLGIPVAAVSNARYAVDSLRQVDAAILDYLATNIGAVLYSSSVAENQPVTITQTGTYTASNVAHQKLIETYFPRLKFKGTARSFESLGKLLGFDDVRVTPLWGRVSPRLPSDPGSPVNDSDFSQIPEYWPRQFTGPAYDPLDQNDGPFYTWSGTASNGTGQTNFYTQLVNGFQPWVRVDILGVDFGTVTHPSQGTYVLAGGAPHQKAFVAAGTDLQFTALGEGASWNGITVGVTDLGGTLARLDITDRLSSIKYRTSYYDLAITMDQDKAEATFGTLTAKTNRDIAPLPGHATAQPYVSFGGTLFGTSPFRPYTGGEATLQSITGIETSDFLTPFAGTVVSFTERHEATLGVYQENYDDLAKAGQGVSQALEEVRPATRSPRRANYGYLQRDTVAYAPFLAENCFAVVSSAGSHVHQFTGSMSPTPLPPVTAQVVFEGALGSYPLAAETIDSDPVSVYFHTTTPGTITGHIVLSGTGTFTYDFLVSGVFTDAGTLCAEFYGTIGQNNSPDTSEVVRPNPPGTDVRYMPRPEDQLDDDLIYETADEYPYRRDILGGGELIETDFSTASGTDTVEYLIADQTTAVKDQTGSDYNVFLIKSRSLTGHRFTVQARPAPYRPGQRAIAFHGQFRDQASLGPDDLGLFVGQDGRTKFFRSELDSVFQPGYQLYHAGLVNGVPVADPDKFNGAHHSQGLVGWLPCNEHPDDDLVVSDAVMLTAVQSITGVSVADREFDAAQGRYLHVQQGASVASRAPRDLGDDLTLSFWLKCEASTAPATERVMSFGDNIVLAIDFSAKIAALGALDANSATFASAFASANDWVHVYLRKTATQLAIGFGDLSNPAVETLFTGNYVSSIPDDGLLTLDAPSKGYFIRDLRIWNRQKTADEMSLVRNYQPKQTVVPYRIGHVLTLNDGDRYGLQVLSNGWLAPSKMPAWVRTPKFAKLVRYNGRGEYQGEDWRKEVGLGGGQIPPTIYQLGNQFSNLTAAGTTVAAPTLGVTPGSNDYWRKDATGAPGSFITLSGSTAQGSLASVSTTGTNSPWPNLMVATNPNQDQIWLKDDAGHAYLCKLEASGGTSARFVARPGTNSNQEQADTIAFLAGTGYTLGVTGYGSVVQKAYSGTDHTPPLYMYLHDALLEDVGGAQTFARWIDPTTFGTQQGFPALKSNGELSLTNTATLVPGTYKLMLDVGNVGKVDQEFDGYRVDLTIGDLTLNETLLPGVKGTNFRGQQEIEFDLDHTVSGDWLLTLSWLNAFTDLARGTARQLILYGYKLRRLETNLFRVDIAASGTNPILTRYPDLRTLDWTHVPGGWLLEFSSYGTIKATAHEGTVYPENDTTRSKYPLANLLTGNTASRREDMIVTTGNFVLPDIADPAISSFGTGIAAT